MQWTSILVRVYMICAQPRPGGKCLPGLRRYSYNVHTPGRPKKPVFLPSVYRCVVRMTCKEKRVGAGQIKRVLQNSPPSFLRTSEPRRVTICSTLYGTGLLLFSIAVLQTCLNFAPVTAHARKCTYTHLCSANGTPPPSRLGSGISIHFDVFLYKKVAVWYCPLCNSGFCFCVYDGRREKEKVGLDPLKPNQGYDESLGDLGNKTSKRFSPLIFCNRYIVSSSFRRVVQGIDRLTTELTGRVVNFSFNAWQQ